MRTLSPKYIGIILGVLYGISIRVFLEFSDAFNFGSLVTISFMFLVPIAIGYIRIYFECKLNKSMSYKQMAVKAWQPIFVFLLVSIVTLLEGSICVAMALPAFMLFASIGGVLAGFVHRKLEKESKKVVMSVALIPLILSPLEVNFLKLSQTYEVKNSVVINAPIDVVWRQLANVSYIAEREFPMSFSQLIGIPRPLQADMNAQGVGAVRTSKWQKNIVFKEVITDWQPNKQMLYQFDIDPDLIPDNALDKHVKLGGEYFSPLYGGYYLAETANGQTVLTLKTTVEDNTNFTIYSRLWGEVIFQDFHNSLLKLMKSRAEKAV
ncbi:SRPBCC family protein [Pseudoalteromonas rhizosphaerae]|uniref:SRPBCC family protein n=1 Tax=Pseudoalteromonas rhizosphaerae TaxID=2518973 RepID=A0ABW8KZA2_9GAMM